MRNIQLSILLLLPGLAMAQAPAKYTVTGQVAHLDAPAKIYLTHFAKY